MSTLVTLNGIPYIIPQTGETGWGQQVSNYLIAIGSGGVLTLGGGAFTLLSDLDFGSNFGVKSKHFTSHSIAPSLTGVVRLGKDDAVVWRNAANTADLPLTVVAGQLTFNGGTLFNASGATGDIPFIAATNTGGVINIGLDSQVLTVQGGIPTWKTPIAPNGITSVVVTGTSVNATSGFRYVLNNVAATVVTLPASPTANDIIGISPTNGLFTNTVDPQGQTILGAAGVMLFDNQYAGVTMQFLNNTWRFI